METHPAPKKSPTGISELVECLYATAKQPKPQNIADSLLFLLQMRDGQAFPISPDPIYIIKTQSSCDSGTVIAMLPPLQRMRPRKQVLIASLPLPGEVTLEKLPNIARSRFPFSMAEIITVHGCRRTSFIHICFRYLRLSKSSQEEDRQRTSSCLLVS